LVDGYGRRSSTFGHGPRDRGPSRAAGGAPQSHIVHRTRIAPALALLVLAPWVGEYLLGNISARDILALPFLVPLYGGGALLIREVTRRTGRGWPTILLLGAAYGVIEAGLVDQLLFDPPLSPESTPVLGISAYNAVAFVVGHAVWSIGVPIALVETVAGREPWLGRVGLVATAALYVFGCLIIFGDQRAATGFLATPTERVAVAATALVLIVVAFLGRRREPGTGPVPRPVPVGVGAFVLTGVFFARPVTWLGVGLGIALIVAAWLLIARWARREAWTDRHRFALAAGTLLTYAWGGFVLTALLEPDDPVRWIGNAVFAALAVALLVLIAQLRRRRGRRGRPAATAATPA
jgi:hypothetical protein